MARDPIPFDQGVFLMHFHKGKECFDLNLLQQAREELETAYNIRPLDEKVLNLLGMTYYKLEMLSEAEDMYMKLTANNPEIHTLQSNLGLIRLKLNKLDQAEQSLGHALDLQPSNPKVHFYLGLLYEKKQQWNDALVHFEEAKAEKMASRIREILARKKMEDRVLPFQVLDVIQEPQLQANELVGDLVSRVIEEGNSANQEPQEDTARMLRHDLVETMEQMEEQIVELPEETPVEPVAETEPPAEQTGNIQDEWKRWIENTGKHPVEEYIETIRSEEPSLESLEETAEESAVSGNEQIPTWEEAAGIEDELPVESSYPSTPPVIEQPFFLAEEMAADISTFLAQSRADQQEDVFVFDSDASRLPSLTAITQEVEIPEFQTTEEVVEERIPTPEEIEQEMASPESQEFIKEEQEERHPFVTVEMADPPTVEELEDEIVEFEIVDETQIPEEPIPVPEPQEEASENLEPEQEHEPEPELGSSEPPAEETHLAGTDDDTPKSLQDVLPEEPAVQLAEESSIHEEIEEEIEESSPVILGFLQPVVEPVQVKPEMEVTQEFVSSEEPFAPVQEDVPLVAATIETEEEHVEPSEKPHEEEIQTTHWAVPPANLDQFSRDRFYVQPLIGADRFLLIDPHLLEVILSDQLVCRIGTISSYTGNLQFTPWEPNSPLIRVSGGGVLFLADRRKEIFLLSINHEMMYVEAAHLLVAQSALTLEPMHIQHKSGRSFSVVKVSGRGTLALTCQTKPLTLNIHEGLPANIPSNAIIAWSGNLTSQVLEDEEIRKILMSRDEDDMFLRYSGSGDVVVEQGGLWGDRRAKR